MRNNTEVASPVIVRLALPCTKLVVVLGVVVVGAIFDDIIVDE